MRDNRAILAYFVVTRDGTRDALLVIGGSRMSRYDYSDPGQDPAYCNGLAADDDSEFCYFCNAHLALNEHYPYCSVLCATLANIDSREDSDYE